MLNEKLDYIITIAEEQNLTRAAKRLFISQPTLTLYLNRLEAELGTKLFDRSRFPVTLTDAGKHYIEEMKKLSASEQRLRNNIKLIANPTKTLIIGIGQVRGQFWLPIILPAFCSIHPYVDIQVIQGTEQYINESLHKSTLDVAFGVLPPSCSDFEVVELLYEKLILTAHKKFGLIPGEMRDQYDPEHPCHLEPAQLKDLPFIIPQIGNGLYDSYEKLILDNKIQPSRTISVNNLNTGLQLALNGLGVQLLSGPILQADQNRVFDISQLDFCTLETMPQTRKCVAAFNDDNIKKNLILDFIRIVQNEVLPRCQYITIINA